MKEAVMTKLLLLKSSGDDPGSAVEIRGGTQVNGTKRTFSEKDRSKGKTFNPPDVLFTADFIVDRATSIMASATEDDVIGDDHVFSVSLSGRDIVKDGTPHRVGGGTDGFKFELEYAVYKLG